jgi:two-component system phosphate regulon response regulator PhoB
MGVTILIADDEPNQLELLAFNLTQEGFIVHRAHDGQEALEKIEDINPDLVILDWMMPVYSGIDLCRKLRDRPETRGLPVIMLSARGEESDRTLGLDTGADDYLTKPFSPKELVARVKALLRRSRPSIMAEIIEVGDITLYPARMEVFCGDRRVDLGPKEYKLLSILIERPGQVFSRAQLLDLVWGHGVYVEERTVDVHLSRLRKALATARPCQEMIRTVRGSGYALQVK